MSGLGQDFDLAAPGSGWAAPGSCFCWHLNLVLAARGHRLWRTWVPGMHWNSVLGTPRLAYRVTDRTSSRWNNVNVLPERAENSVGGDLIPQLLVWSRSLRTRRRWDRSRMGALYQGREDWEVPQWRRGRNLALHLVDRP